MCKARCRAQPAKKSLKNNDFWYFLFKILDNYVLCVTVPLQLKLGV